jgi:hypothetical protein
MPLVSNPEDPEIQPLCLVTQAWWGKQRKGPLVRALVEDKVRPVTSGTIQVRDCTRQVAALIGGEEKHSEGWLSDTKSKQPI